MAEDTKIQWATHTFNTWRGCQKISPGCANCYAETLSGRNPGTLGTWGPNGTRVVAAEAQWKLPAKWNKAAAKAGERHRVFCASLADIFEDWPGRIVMSNGQWATINRSGGKFTGYIGCNLQGGTDALTMQHVRERLFNLIDTTPNLDWLVLTKRPENIARMMPPFSVTINYREKRSHSTHANPNRFAHQAKVIEHDRVRHNLWLGVSVEDQQRADERIPILMDIPATVKFLSCEPLLESLSLRRWLGWREEMVPKHGVDWVIIGGESGGKARRCRVEWVRNIMRQCLDADIACFVKQLGDEPRAQTHDDFRIIGSDCHSLLSHKGGVMEEWPEDLRVREFPCVPR